MIDSPAKYVESWMGAVQGDPTHKFIIDSYNSIKPLPNGYKLKYTDAWCAGTISAAYHLSGLDAVFPSECSCGRMIKKAQDMGIWVESDNYVPKRGDCIMYDWQDSGNGDCTGAPEHTGIVLSVSNNVMYIGEGNYGNAHKVATRKVAINGKYIRGFIVPKINLKDDAPNDKSNSEIAKEVIAGKWGTGNDRRQRLTKAGYDYATIQKLVNEMLKK